MTKLNDESSVLIRAVLDGKRLQMRRGLTGTWTAFSTPSIAIRAVLDDDGEYELRIAPEPHIFWTLVWLSKGEVEKADYNNKEEAVESCGNVAYSVGPNGLYALYRVEIDPETLAVTTVKEPGNGA